MTIFHIKLSLQSSFKQQILLLAEWGWELQFTLKIQPFLTLTHNRRQKESSTCCFIFDSFLNVF